MKACTWFHNYKNAWINCTYSTWNGSLTGSSLSTLYRVVVEVFIYSIQPNGIVNLFIIHCYDDDEHVVKSIQIWIDNQLQHCWSLFIRIVSYWKVNFNRNQIYLLSSSTESGERHQQLVTRIKCLLIRIGISIGDFDNISKKLTMQTSLKIGTYCSIDWNNYHGLWNN